MPSVLRTDSGGAGQKFGRPKTGNAVAIRQRGKNGATLFTLGRYAFGGRRIHSESEDVFRVLTGK